MPPGDEFAVYAPRAVPETLGAPYCEYSDTTRLGPLSNLASFETGSAFSAVHSVAQRGETAMPSLGPGDEMKRRTGVVVGVPGGWPHRMTAMGGKRTSAITAIRPRAAHSAHQLPFRPARRSISCSKILPAFAFEKSD